MTYPGVSDSKRTDQHAAAVAADVVRAFVTGKVIRGMWDDRSSASQVVIGVSGLLAVALYVSQGVLPYVVRDAWLDIAGTMSAVMYIALPATIMTATKWAVAVAVHTCHAHLRRDPGNCRAVTYASSLAPQSVARLCIGW
jgi:hypothetical protein